MIRGLSLYVLLLLQNCSSYLSPASLRAPVRVWGCIRHGRVNSILRVSSAENPPPPDGENSAQATGCGVAPGLSSPCAGKASLPAVLADYPRSSFSKIGIKLTKPPHLQGEAEVSSDRQGLMQVLQESDEPKPEPTEAAAQSKEFGSKLDSSLTVHSDLQPEAQVRLNGLLSANPSAWWLCAGRVTGAHGLRGFLKIEPATFAKTERFCTRGSRLFFRSRGSCMPFVTRAVEEGRLLPRAGRPETALVKLQGIEDRDADGRGCHIRDAANSLAGSLVCVPASQSLACLPPKCLLAAELIGFEVALLHDAERTRIGRITDVISKHDMRLREEALGAADDCLQIEVYGDLPGRRLLMQHFKDPTPPPAPLLASALHALGSATLFQEAPEEVPVLFECEGCGLRFTDCTAAVCHERLCLVTSKNTGGSQSQDTAGQEQSDALQWLLQEAISSAEAPEGRENMQTLLSTSPTYCSEPVVTEDHNSSAPGLTSPSELQSLDGPHGRSGTRLGRRFLERLSLGSRVSWDREGRFFPRKGEGKEEAAERALAFACNNRAGRGYAEADWNDPHDITAISRHLISPALVQPAACNADQRPAGQSFLLPFVLGLTVDDIDTESKTLGINAPPALLH